MYSVTKIKYMWSQSQSPFLKGEKWILRWVGGGGGYLEYLKREWNRKKWRGNKNFKKWGQTGSRCGCPKKGGDETLYKLWWFVIFFIFWRKYFLSPTYYFFNFYITLFDINFKFWVKFWKFVRNFFCWRFITKILSAKAFRA